MRNEEEKSKIELSVFEEFAIAANIGLIIGSAKKGNPDLGEPDIQCELAEGIVYFELAEACAPEFAAVINDAIKNNSASAVWGEDVSANTIKNKLRKKYQVSEPVELLLYLAGRSALPEDVIAAQISPIISNDLGPFRRVWLFDQTARLLAS